PDDAVRFGVEILPRARGPESGGRASVYVPGTIRTLAHHCGFSSPVDVEPAVETVDRADACQDGMERDDVERFVTHESFRAFVKPEDLVVVGRACQEVRRSAPSIDRSTAGRKPLCLPVLLDVQRWAGLTRLRWRDEADLQRTVLRCTD